MLIQELVHQDHIKYSRGVSLFGSCLDQVKKEKKTSSEDLQEKTCVYVCFVKILFLDKM